MLERSFLAQGYRLACEHYLEQWGAEETLVLALPEAAFAKKEQTPSVRSQRPCVLAVDVGTSTICWACQDTAGAPLARGQTINPQGGVGSDLVSRLQAARDPARRKTLSHRLWHCLQGILTQLPLGVERIVLAANTGMTLLFLDEDIEGLCQAPFHHSVPGNMWIERPGFPPIYIPPLPGPFIGSDIVLGVLSLAKEARCPWLLIDLGTNAEFALQTKDQLFLTSVPMGPAMEGIGMRCGQSAGDGVINRFFVDHKGLAGLCTETGEIYREQKAVGISATGYFSLLALLLGLGVVNRDGCFVETATMPVAKRILDKVCKQGKRVFLPLPGDVFLDGFDIEACLEVKAAFCIAIQALLEAAHLRPDALATVYLGGALGEHVGIADLRALGFLSKAVRQIVSIGNTALQGALALALHPEESAALATSIAKARCIPLTEHPRFHERFVDNMHFACMV